MAVVRIYRARTMLIILLLLQVLLFCGDIEAVRCIYCLAWPFEIPFLEATLGGCAHMSSVNLIVRIPSQPT